jgi:hypothetical protein
MDEIFGYFPPRFNPPTKKPMLTLLKQARAFGVGIMLATQNPVDLDYKGLANIGTWFIGRLQTDNDKQRVIDGLEGATSEGGEPFNRRQMEAMLSQLGSRVFLMHNTHEPAPVVFHSRWAMSYLRGPLTREQLRKLTGNRKQPVPEPEAAAEPAAPRPVRRRAVADSDIGRPILPPGVVEQFHSVVEGAPEGVAVEYRPVLCASAKLHFVRVKARLDKWLEAQVVLPLDDDALDFANMVWYPAAGVELDEQPESGSFADLPEAATRLGQYRSWKARLKEHLYHQCPAKIWYCPDLKVGSETGQSLGAFRGQLRHSANEKRDEMIVELRMRYAKKLQTVNERIRKTRQRIDREQEQYNSARVSTAVSFGGAFFNALLGRSSAATRAGTAVRGVSRSSKQRGDVKRARADLLELERDVLELEAELRREMGKLEDKYDPATIHVESMDVRPRKADIKIESLGVLWQPWLVADDGARPLFARPGPPPRAKAVPPPLPGSGGNPKF